MNSPYALPLLGLCLFVAGCTTQGSSAGLGLVSAPIPAAAPFVVESRTAVTPAYPAIGVTPPARADAVLTETERLALEAQLKSHRLSSPKRIIKRAP